MLHDSELVAETRGSLTRARDDLRAGEVDLGAAPPLTADAVFRAQQVAEKAMKGLLTWHSKVFRKSHNLTEIGALCLAIDSTLGPLLGRAATLTDYAWKFRYPGEPEVPPLSEAQSALALARQVYEAILDRLPAELRP